MKETGLLNSQDIDRVVEDSLDEEGEEMVADDVKKGSIPIRLVNQAKTEEQKYTEKMKVLDVVDRKEASGSKVIRTKWLSHKEHQRNNQMSGLDGLHRSTNGWTGLIVSITLRLLDWIW